MPPAVSPPETYFITHSTPHVPNSRLPVLVYRSALPPNPTPDSTCARIEPNNWIKGGVFKHYPVHHFHSVTHECYAVFNGYSKLLLGRGPLDPEEEDDLLVDLREGDAIVLPAGVAHCSMNKFLGLCLEMERCFGFPDSDAADLESSDDYEYVGLYPKGSPHYDNNFCKAGEEETSLKAANAKAVPIPESDPIFGVGGPLIEIWRKALV